MGGVSSRRLRRLHLGGRVGETTVPGEPRSGAAARRGGRGRRSAVAGIALLGPELVHRGPAGTLPVRGAEPRPAVTVVLPADRAVLGAAPNFTWRAVPGATAYRILVSRPDGDSVWATTTSDTTVRGPEDVSRAGPGLYYWYVDVLFDDARSAAGLAHEFRIEP